MWWGRRGGSGPKMVKWRGLLLIIALWPLHKGKKGLRGRFEFEWHLPFSAYPLFLFPQPPLPRFLPASDLSTDPKRGGGRGVGGKEGGCGDKDRAQSNQANSANKSSVGSLLPVLTHFTVSVAKQKLECLATGRHSILMEWRPHARLPCAWSV